MPEQYTPTTKEVRTAYVERRVQPTRIFNTAWGWEMSSAEFDAWLAATVRAAKAEAWDEGNDAGEICAMDAESPDHECQPNPYRQEADQ